MPGEEATSSKSQTFIVDNKRTELTGVPGIATPRFSVQHKAAGDGLIQKHVIKTLFPVPRPSGHLRKRSRIRLTVNMYLR